MMGSDSGLGLSTTYQNKRKSKKAPTLLGSFFIKKNNNMTTAIAAAAHSVVHAKKVFMAAKSIKALSELI
ncbi:TPA: hypothetical protein ACKP2D_004222 [Serratia marcescens]